MNEFCCDTSKKFALTLYSVRWSIFKFALNIHPTVMNLAQRGEKRAAHCSSFNFALEIHSTPLNLKES